MTISGQGAGKRVEVAEKCAARNATELLEGRLLNAVERLTDRVDQLLNRGLERGGIDR